MSFPDDTFDIVVSNEFMSHVNNIDKAIAEQVRVLKKKGVMIIMDANFLDPLNFISNFLVDYIRSRGKLGGFRWLFHRHEPIYIRVPTKQGFREVSYNSENTHSRRWWTKKLAIYSPQIEFGVSTFCSFVPLKLPQLPSNKILAVGYKL
jgi:ubiquinone/menaquinone biosynthesis C-methylase UbiE